MGVVTRIACKEFCLDEPRRGIYAEGFKSCSQCKRFFKTKDSRCKCCGLRLKSKPRSSPRKKIHNQKMGMVRF